MPNGCVRSSCFALRCATHISKIGAFCCRCLCIGPAENYSFSPAIGRDVYCIFHCAVIVKADQPQQATQTITVGRESRVKHWRSGEQQRDCKIRDTDLLRLYFINALLRALCMCACVGRAQKGTSEPLSGHIFIE